MEIEIKCWDEEVFGEGYHFYIKLPKNTKRVKMSFHVGSPNNEDAAKQIIVDEIEFYEDKS